MCLLKIKELTFDYPSSDSAPFRFDLELRAGKILALTGKSGSGKSTLLDLIAGFLRPYSGHIELDGVDILPLHPSNRQVSILFQKNNLFEHLTVLENTCLALSPNKKPSAEQIQRAMQILGEVEMASYASRITSTLSGGQMQRVALARELLRDSKLFLLDEPFTGLDEPAQRNILPLLKNIVRPNDRSIILVTHDLDSVGEIIDETAQIRDQQLHFL